MAIDRSVRFDWLDEAHTVQEVQTHPDCHVVAEIHRLENAGADGETRWDLVWRDGATEGGCIAELFPTLAEAQAFASAHVAPLAAGEPV